MKYIKIYPMFFALLLVSASEATKPSIPSLKMEMSIQHDGYWEVGKENTVTFIFKPIEEVKHINRHPDEAFIVLDSGLIFLSGDTSWSGFLEKDTQYSISAILKPIKSGKMGVHGKVMSVFLKEYSEEELKRMQEDYIRLIEQSPVLREKQKGYLPKYPKKAYFYRNYVSSLIEVTGMAPVTEDTSWHDINGAKIRNVTVVKPLSELVPPPSLTDNPKVINQPDSSDILNSQRRDSTKSNLAEPK